MILPLYYRLPRQDDSYLATVRSDLKFHQLMNKHCNNTIYIIGGYFNARKLTGRPTKSSVHHTTPYEYSSHYPLRVSQTYLDIAMDIGLEQLVDFPTSLENTHDLIFITHPSSKIRYKPLPPIGQKSDRDIFLLDTAHCMSDFPAGKIIFGRKQKLTQLSSS